MAENRGRPSAFTPELAALICKRLAEGRTLRDVCRDDDMPPESTVRTWALENRDGFFAQYEKSREIGYLAMADETIEIADDGTNDWMEREGKDGSTYEVVNSEVVQRSRLRVDTRKWLLSKALPKIFGERVVQEHTGADGGPLLIGAVNDADRAKALAAFIAKTKPK